MYDNILLPTDGNQGMLEVATEARRLATLCDARIHALHAIDGTAFSSIPDDARELVRERLEEDGEMATQTIAERVGGNGVDVIRAVRQGPPAHVIVDYALEHDVDLIIMGTHGRTGYERYLLGSVAERVVRSAPMPVLTVSLVDRTDAEDVIAGGLPTPIAPPNPAASADDDSNASAKRESNARVDTDPTVGTDADSSTDESTEEQPE